MNYPKFAKIQQDFSCDTVNDIDKAVTLALDYINLKEKVSGGKRIAITAGSRGITDIDKITKLAVDYIKNAGGIPFIVPSMGSHGGATAEGQIEVLKAYGISEDTMGCEIISSMEVVLLGNTENGAPVYIDKNALESDGILSLNRVKPHTDFIGVNESGIVKMLSVGLGKEAGATMMHGYDLGKTIPLAFEIILKKAPVIGGLAIVENSRDETFLIEGVLPENFLKRDAELLEIAKKQVPQLPSSNWDILIVKEMGKQFSGTGMDTKVIGRIMVNDTEEPKSPSIGKLVVLNLSKDSYGNALGIGLADITTKKLVESINRNAMYSNLIPTTYLTRGKIPISFDNDKLAIDMAIKTLGSIRVENLRIGIIENTLELQTLYVTENMLNSMESVVKVVEKGIELLFDEQGDLLV